MTLDELVTRYRPHLEDESVRVRRSWEEMFTYTLRLYPRDTPLEAFDVHSLEQKLISAGLHPPVVNGYVKRWADLLARAQDL